MIIKIERKKSGNCGCANCGASQEGLKLHPYTVWWKSEGESRGHNDPVCCLDCAMEYAKEIKERLVKTVAK